MLVVAEDDLTCLWLCHMHLSCRVQRHLVAPVVSCLVGSCWVLLHWLHTSEMRNRPVTHSLALIVDSIINITHLIANNIDLSWRNKVRRLCYSKLNFHSVQLSCCHSCSYWYEILQDVSNAAGIEVLIYWLTTSAPQASLISHIKSQNCSFQLILLLLLWINVHRL